MVKPDIKELNEAEPVRREEYNQSSNKWITEWNEQQMALVEEC